MKNNILLLKNPFLVLLLAVFLFGNINAERDKSEKGNSKADKSLKRAGDAYRMFINNVDLPMSSSGVIADVNIGGRAYGRVDGKVFLFSGGFFVSGQSKGKVWANAVASASRIQDYVKGTVEHGRNDSRAQLYVLKQTDGDFGASWTIWKDAVALGAYYYDGDGNGVYDPKDLNGNGKWDRTEDRPDLIGDETVWCVYNDGVDPALRRFNDVDPQGIEIRQSVFAFNSKGVVGNMIFLRYSLLNTGTVSDVLDSVYFGVWADPDLGDYNNDFVGSDAPQSSSGYPKADTAGLDAGYVYDNGPDGVFGVNSPTFLIDFFQGPISYIPGVTFTDVNNNGIFDAGDIAKDTAHNVQGQARGVGKIPGAKNVGLSSFVHYMQSHQTVGDPNTRLEARNYMLGFDKLGKELDPATWAFGTVRGGVNPASIDRRFWYSGDPVADIGWINNLGVDQRQMSNTGPFKLEKGKPVDIVVAYVVGRSPSNSLASVNVAKNLSKIAQLLFDSNFPSPPPPPPVKPVISTGENFIDIAWPTNEQITYRAVDTVLDIDRRFQGYYLNAYRSNSKSPSIGGIENVKEVVNFDLKDFINNYYTFSPNGGLDLARAEAAAGNKLDSAVYAKPTTGRLKVRISKDPFTDGPLIKGKEYYFAITTYTLNHKVIFLKDTKPRTYGVAGDYADSTGGGLEEYETAIIPVTFGKDLFSPENVGGTGNAVSGISSGAVKYVVVNKEALTGDTYSVQFKNKKNPTAYGTYWQLKNDTKNIVLIDSSDVFDFDTTKYAGIVYDGFIPKVKASAPALGTIASMKYTSTKKPWFKTFSSESGTGAYYVGLDMASSPKTILPKSFPSPIASSVTKADSMKHVEIRFGAPNAGKAYRYLHGFAVGSFLQTNAIFRYAEGVTDADTVGKGEVGKFGQGFVDVPFTAWAIDKVTKKERQLAVGFIESRKFPNRNPVWGNADGFWNPDTSSNTANEVIIVFDYNYKADGSHKELTGGDFNGTKVWANLAQGWTPPEGSGLDTLVAKSRLFNALYVVVFRQDSAHLTYTPGDILTIPVSSYPYTDKDKFTFATNKGGLLSEEQKKDLFNKVTVFPNPLFAYNPATSYNNGNPDEPFVTFSNLPDEVTIKVYTLSGILIRTMTTQDKMSATSPFLRWNLENESGLRVASGVYLAIVSSPGFGEKILKFSIIMPQKQIQRF